MGQVVVDPASSELVPLAERVRYMQMFRLGLSLVVVLLAAITPDLLDVGLRDLSPSVALYISVSLVGGWLWRSTHKRGLLLFGAMLMIDGIYLAWLSYATGGITSPFRYAILVHLIAVALLASYRTGLKLALWHSLLLFVVFHAQRSQILQPPSEAVKALPGTEFEALTAFAIVFWLVAIATASYSAINERELRRRRFDLEALARMATKIEDATDTRAVAQVLLEQVADIFDLNRSLLLASVGGELTLMATNDIATTPQSVAGSDDSAIRWVRHNRKTLLVKLDETEDPWLASIFSASANVVLVPLSAEGTSLGVLVIEHSLKSGSRIERRVLSMIERFASHGALALRNASFLEHVQQMAETDGLTKIANRRTFESALTAEMSRAGRTKQPLSLILLDIDRFKKLNDTHGHQQGDEVLREVAQLLQGSSRDFDTAARYGGEEFAVILPGVGLGEAAKVAERLRKLIMTANTVVPVTASFGVAAFPAQAADPDALVSAADAALYSSKRGGRNKVTRSRKRARDLHLVDAVGGASAEAGS
jgi:two-component system, cell cycle response regulator